MPIRRILPFLVRGAMIPIVLGWALPAASQDHILPVPSVGTLQNLVDAGEKPDPKASYHIVFDVQTPSESSDEPNPALQAIGGLINTYRSYGVPASHLSVTAVFHGRTILLVTRDATYAQRTGTTANPNATILRELAAAGVSLVVCGQSAAMQHFAPSNYLPNVHTNLSATVTFINLETSGYVKVSE